MSLLVREIVTWSGVGSSSPIDRNCRNVSESARRHAMPRSLSSPSKKPIIMMRKYRPGARSVQKYIHIDEEHIKLAMQRYGHCPARTPNPHNRLPSRPPPSH